jgi:preprotein translocase subunit SecF
VLFDFALALTIGIVIGTYSSVFVASPIIVEWENRSPRRVK